MLTIESVAKAIGPIWSSLNRSFTGSLITHGRTQQKLISNCLDSMPKKSVVFKLQLFDLTKLIGRPTLNGVVLLGRNRWRRRRRRSRRRSRGVMTLVWRTFDGARFAFVDGTLWRRCLVFFKWTKPGLFLLILVTFNNNFYRKMIVVVEGKYADHQMQGAYVPPFACLQRLQSNVPMLGYFWQRMK